jgi:transcription elongation GreA/GreB family factor
MKEVALLSESEAERLVELVVNDENRQMRRKKRFIDGRAIEQMSEKKPRAT